MTESHPHAPTESNSAPEASQAMYTRFDLGQRISHAVMLTSFTVLGITGLAQKFIESPISLALMEMVGGIEGARLVHRTAAVALMIVSVYHILDVLYRVFVLRSPWSMVPVISDFKHLVHDVAYYLGMREHKAHYGRFSYVEKAEYLALVWGTVLMGITGFMMWNPIATTRWLPGEAVPAAKAAHGGEAILAVLAIIIWHMYHVHIKLFNRSMFTGKLTQAEMEHEHPAELAEIKNSQERQHTHKEGIRKRRRIFLPIAAVLTAIFALSIIAFTTLEKTAIETVPRGETVQVFKPLTPTPRPSLAPTPTPKLEAGITVNSWQGSIDGLFRNRCSTCHGRTAVGGLTLGTYPDALKGGSQGAAVVPGDSEASILVQVQRTGNHPGQLTPEELEQVIEWINAGAPEK